MKIWKCQIDAIRVIFHAINVFFNHFWVAGSLLVWCLKFTFEFLKNNVQLLVPNVSIYVFNNFGRILSFYTPTNGYFSNNRHSHEFLLHFIVCSISDVTSSACHLIVCAARPQYSRRSLVWWLPITRALIFCSCVIWVDWENIMEFPSCYFDLHVSLHYSAIFIRPDSPVLDLFNCGKSSVL